MNRFNLHLDTRTKENLIRLVGVAIVATLGWNALPQIQRNNAEWSKQLDLQRQTNTRQEMLANEKESLAAAAEVADQRLTDGCTVFPIAKNGSFANVAEGMSVVNPDTGYPYSAGSTACDPWGVTGVFAYVNSSQVPVLTNIAVTHNQKLIRQAMAKHGLSLGAGNGQFNISQPKAGH
jgi:hypothetical protein